MTRRPRPLRLAALAAAAVALLAACSSGSTTSGAAPTGAGSTGAGSTSTGASGADSAAASSPSSVAGGTEELVGTGTGGIVVYNAQHEDLTQAWADEFTKETGIAVEMRNGSDNELANQIVAEGSGSPADVFLTENSPGMNIVEQAGLFAPVDAATTAAVPSQFNPSTGNWVGIAARSTVFAYNTDQLAEADLPKSIMDLQDPAWEGRWAASAGGADFQAIVSAILELKGSDATSSWLDAMKTNAKIYKGNNTVMKAVNAGEIPGGVIYHYYWYVDQAKTGENSNKTKLLFWGDQDPGAFLSVSGGGVLASSTKQQQAQQFLKFITSKAGQQVVADTVLEYPIGSDVAANPALKPITQLQPPTIDPASLNGPEVADLMTQAGLI
ncbi:MAG TPA: iron ABC transporter substrate-binding protein [Nakamurella sp.]|nr:iron ABC transporter substrate-binding protein [Nakamurella sp.]